MSSFTLICWPYYADRNERAKEHFNKAKEGIGNLMLGEDVAFCLGRNKRTSLDLGILVFYLVGAYRGGINDSSEQKALQEFFEKCGCPGQAEWQSPDIGRDLTTVDNFASRLAQSGIEVSSGPVIKRLKSQTFLGESADAARATARAAILSDINPQLEVIRDVQEKTIEEKGKSANEAIEAAKAQVPSDAFDVSPAKITGQGVRGLTWAIPFRAQIHYKMPAAVRARFYEVDFGKA